VADVGGLCVLMVTPRYLPYMGGVERAVHETSKRLALRGIDITVLTTDTTAELPRHELMDGVQVVRVPAWPRKRDYYFAPDVYRIVAATECDVVHVQSYHTFVAPMAMLAAVRHHHPFVVTFHGGGHSSRVRNALRRPQWAALRPLLARADRLVAIARFEIDDYGRRLRVPRDRFVLIPNGIGVNMRTDAAVNRDASRPVIASIGRLERYKGHHRLIEALPHILEQCPDARAWIAGVGPYERELRALARRLGVVERVDIRAVPATDADAMARELAKVSLVVLLSDHETQPITALEAIAAGRPVLVFDTTGLSELADSGLARAIPKTSTPEEVAAAVVEELRNPFTPTDVDLPTWDECAEQHVHLYRAVLAQRDRQHGLAG
jgi:glycosyltransferase involved in cell wall biosynthesis